MAPFGAPVIVRDALEDDECRWFLEAVSRSVVTFRECPPSCFRFKKWGVAGPDHFDTPSGKPRHLFSKPATDVAWLNREYVPHIAAYGRAIVDFRLLGHEIVVLPVPELLPRPHCERAGRSYETDAEFYDHDGGIHLQWKPKATRAATAKLVAQMERAGTLAELPVGTIKEIEYVLDLGPRFLWVVGPGSVEPASYVYAVEVSGLNASFSSVGAFPPPP